MMTAAQISQLLKQDDVQPAVLAVLQQDPRVSVVRLVQQWQRRQRAQAEERQRVLAMYAYERKLRESGYSLIAGVDEAGRGPLAGPVVVGAVILPEEWVLPVLNDSKKLSAKQREVLYTAIKASALAVHSVFIEPVEIDRLNIYEASRQGMYRAIAGLFPQPDAVLADAMPLPALSLYSLSLIGGDAKSASIAAASIVAKVERDRRMYELDAQYPGYGFAKHKGYGTQEHMAALRRYGPCPVHRRSFEPVKSEWT